MAPGFKRIHHYHIRKTAGTSLNAAFWALGGLDLRGFGSATRTERGGLVFVRHDPRLIDSGDYFFSNAHTPAYRLSLPPRTFTVTILRDPLARIYSHYRYLHWAREPAPDHSVAEPFLGALKQETCWLGGGSFSEFLRNIPKCHLLHQLHMFSEDFDVSEAAMRIRGCHAVCFTETFPCDLARLSQSLGLPLAEKQERRFGGRPPVSEADLDVARHLLAPEYALLEAIHDAHIC